MAISGQRGTVASLSYDLCLFKRSGPGAHFQTYTLFFANHTVVDVRKGKFVPDQAQVISS